MTINMLKPERILSQRMVMIDNDFDLRWWTSTRNIIFATLWHVLNPNKMEHCFLEGTTVPENDDAFYLSKDN
jgi:hypothetical protein